MDKFDYCGDCIYLSLSEAEQNKTKPKLPHRCMFYRKRVLHQHHHPHILRLYDCLARGSKRRYDKTNTELRIG